MEEHRNETPDGEYCQPPFERVSEQNKNPSRFAEEPENVRRSDVPAADRADVDSTRFRDQKSRRNRAQQIGREGSEDVSRNEHAIVYGCTSAR